jgi:hypothetical protein
MSPWFRATYAAQEDASECVFRVSRPTMRCDPLRFDRVTLLVRRSAALRSSRLSTGMPGICPFLRPRKPHGCALEDVE